MTSDYRAERGKRLRQLRKERGLSLKEITAKAQVSKAWYCRIENGEARQVSDDVLVRLAAALDAPIEDVFVYPTGQAAS